MTPYEVKPCKGYWIIVDKKDNVVWVSRCREQCERIIENGDLDKIVAMCDFYCN